jgi:hypothetical protein
VLLLLVDEVQVSSTSDRTLLAASLHQLNVHHPSVVEAFAASGLAHGAQRPAGAGVTHPDRLFTLEQIPPALDESVYAGIEPASGDLGFAS